MTWLRVKTKKGHNFPSVDPNRKAQRLTELLSLGFLIHNAVLWTTQTPWYRRSPLWDFKICIWQKVGHRFYSEAPIRTNTFKVQAKAQCQDFPILPPALPSLVYSVIQEVLLSQIKWCPALRIRIKSWTKHDTYFSGPFHWRDGQ